MESILKQPDIVEVAVKNLPLLVLLCREGWITKTLRHIPTLSKSGDTEKIAIPWIIKTTTLIKFKEISNPITISEMGNHPEKIKCKEFAASAIEASIES